MNSRFKELLPGNVQRLVDEIEDFASLQVEVHPNLRPLSSTEPNPDTLGCKVSESRAVIYYRKEEHFLPQAVLHELLHVRRYWVEQVPRILPVENGERARITSQIENTLEHLVIVPREENYGFEPYVFWNETARKNWMRYPWPDITSAWARRKNCLLGWLTVNYLVRDQGVRKAAEEVLRKEGLLLDAQNFAAKIQRVLLHKPRAISAVTRFLVIPQGEAQLVYFDVRNRKRLVESIPQS